MKNQINDAVLKAQNILSGECPCPTVFEILIMRLNNFAISIEGNSIDEATKNIFMTAINDCFARYEGVSGKPKYDKLLKIIRPISKMGLPAIDVAIAEPITKVQHTGNIEPLVKAIIEQQRVILDNPNYKFRPQDIKTIIEKFDELIPVGPDQCRMPILNTAQNNHKKLLEWVYR